jgi:hypothetical protein
MITPTLPRFVRFIAASLCLLLAALLTILVLELAVIQYLRWVE